MLSRTKSPASGSAWEGALLSWPARRFRCKRRFHFTAGNIAPALLPRVADLHAPILFFWGGLDKHIGPEQTRAIVDEFKRFE